MGILSKLISLSLSFPFPSLTRNILATRKDFLAIQKKSQAWKHLSIREPSLKRTAPTWKCMVGIDWNLRFLFSGLCYFQGMYLPGLPNISPKNGILKMIFRTSRLVGYVNFLEVYHQNGPLHPGRLTWNIQITHFERNMIFQTSRELCSSR